jgi:hypothetical protein
MAARAPTHTQGGGYLNRRKTFLNHTPSRAIVRMSDGKHEHGRGAQDAATRD